MNRLNMVPEMGGALQYPDMPSKTGSPSGNPTGGGDLSSQQQVELSKNVYPSPSAYPGTATTTRTSEMEPVIHPMHAPPTMPSGLQLPPGGPQFPGSVQNPSTAADLYSTPMFPSTSTFIAKKSENKVFAVTITNMEELNTIKSHYKPNAGSKYVIVYLSQQNISTQTQIYSGKFSLVDGDNKIYEYLEGLSNFWLVILKPGAVNFGYLVFEVPQGSTATRLVLHALNQEPFSVKLD